MSPDFYSNRRPSARTFFLGVTCDAPMVEILQYVPLLNNMVTIYRLANSSNIHPFDRVVKERYNLRA